MLKTSQNIHLSHCAHFLSCYLSLLLLLLLRCVTLLRNSMKMSFLWAVNQPAHKSSVSLCRTFSKKLFMLCTFVMAVYVAIESHRLYFHLANSKQLNLMWLCCCVCIMPMLRTIFASTLFHFSIHVESLMRAAFFFLHFSLLSEICIYILLGMALRSCDNFEIETFG